MRTLQRLGFMALLLLLPLAAFGAGEGAPLPRFSETGRDIAYGVAKQRVWTVVEQLATANVEGSIPSAGAGTIPAVIPFDALVIVRPDGGKAGCIFSMTSDILFGDLTGESQCQVDDHGDAAFTTGPADGPGACFRVPDLIAIAQVPNFEKLYKLPGMRPSLCTNGRALSSGLTARRRPCKAYATVATSAVTISSNVATVTATGHGLRPGMEITIASITTPLTTQAPILTTADANTLTVALTAANGAMADGTGVITVTPCPVGEGTCDAVSVTDLKTQGGAILRCQVGTNNTLVEVAVEQ